MGKFTKAFWNLLGAQANQNQKNALALVAASHKYDDWAAEIPIHDVPDIAVELDFDKNLNADQPKLLAILSRVAESTLGLKPYDVQLQGALRLVVGDVIEMATGEGKTLSGAIAAAIKALSGHKVHVVSVNDYLAKRDCLWMKPFFDALDISSAYITESTSRNSRKLAYQAQIMYGSVNEIGFDVLKDNLVTKAKDLVTVPPDVAIIDEADSVLVDEALVPLVLAGSTEVQVPSNIIIEAVKKLKKGFHYQIDDDKRNVFLTEAGANALEAELEISDIYSPAHVSTTLIQVNVALHAVVLLDRDIHYIVRDGKINLINASRGRIAQLQRWPDGLQAAVEAKEGLTQSDSGEVLDTITVQALISRYKFIAGMTGTALAAGEQLRKFYNLGVSVIPHAKSNIRIDEPERVYDTKINKFFAIIEHVKKIHATGQPILIGTHDVAESEEIAMQLNKVGINPIVLNAKNDAEEANIISQAGTKYAVTVSTQMAGRGTDIRLGGTDDNPDIKNLRNEVIDLGGLYVIGTGRHDTKRLDNQLRGRAGRQGDPGTTIFFTSLEDPIVQRHKPETRFPTNCDESGLFPYGKANKIVAQAQKIAEGIMLEIHSNTWNYNSLVNKQRNEIMEYRNKLITTDTALTELKTLAPKRYSVLIGEEAETNETNNSPELVPLSVLEQAAREIILYHLDRGWANHLAYATDIRENIHLRALGKENPIDEFHRLIVENFKKLLNEVKVKAKATFETIEITETGIDLVKTDELRRSTATWTYMVHENPLENSSPNDLQRMVGIFG